MRWKACTSRAARLLMMTAAMIFFLCQFYREPFSHAAHRAEAAELHNGASGIGMPMNIDLIRFASAHQHQHICLAVVAQFRHKRHFRYNVIAFRDCDYFWLGILIVDKAIRLAVDINPEIAFHGCPPVGICTSGCPSGGSGCLPNCCASGSTPKPALLFAIACCASFCMRSCSSSQS